MYARGTAWIASSDARITVGRIISASVIAPASTLFDGDTRAAWMKNASPNRPNTMLGTPASVWMHVRSSARKRLSFAYSVR